MIYKDTPSNYPPGFDETELEIPEEEQCEGCYMPYDECECFEEDEDL